MSRSPSKSLRFPLSFVFFFLSVALVLGISVALLPPDIFWSTDEGNKFIQIQNITTTGNIFLDYPGKGIDPGFRFFPYSGNHFIPVNGAVYSYHPFYFPYLTHYFYRMFGKSGIYFLPVFGTLLCLIFMHLLLRHFDIQGKLNLAGGFALLFCTPLFYYSITLWEHSLALAGWLGAVLLLLKKPDWRSALASGVLTAFSTILREEGYILVIAVCLAVVIVYRSTSRALAFAAGWSVTLLPVWLLNWSLFSSIFGLHAITYNAGGFGRLGLFTPEMFRTFLSNLYVYLGEFHSTVTKTNIIALPLFFSAALGFGLPASADRFRMGILMVVVSVSSFALFELITSASPIYNAVYTQGLLPAIPLFLFPLLWARRFCSSDHVHFRFLFLLSILFTGGICLVLNQNYFGLLWGPRHFFPLFPILLLLALDAFKRIQTNESKSRKRFTAGFVFLFAISMMIQLHGIQILHMKKSADRKFIDAASQAAEQVIVTDVFWIPEGLARVFFLKKIFMVGSDQDLGLLLQLLRKEGIEQFLYIAGRHQRKISQTAAVELIRMTTKRENIRFEQFEFGELMLLHCRLQ